MEIGPLRLFFGLPLPPEPQAELGRWQRRYGNLEGWSRPEGLHLTLAFLGERGMDSLPALEGAGAAVARRHKACDLRTSGLGGFPGGRTTRLLFLGLEPGAALDALEAVAADLRGALTAAGAAFDPKPFHPHLTLARFRRPQPLATFSTPDPADFRADALALFMSQPQGHYTPLRSWDLRKV